MSKHQDTQQKQQVDEANKGRPANQRIKDGREGHSHKPSK